MVWGEAGSPREAWQHAQPLRLPWGGLPEPEHSVEVQLGQHMNISKSPTWVFHCVWRVCVPRNRALAAITGNGSFCSLVHGTGLQVAKSIQVLACVTPTTSTCPSHFMCCPLISIPAYPYQRPLSALDRTDVRSSSTADPWPWLVLRLYSSSWGSHWDSWVVVAGPSSSPAGYSTYDTKRSQKSFPKKS